MSWRTCHDFRVLPRQRLRRGSVQSEFLSYVYSRFGKHARVVHQAKDRARIHGNDGEPEDSHDSDATVRKVAKRRDLV